MTSLSSTHYTSLECGLVYKAELSTDSTSRGSCQVKRTEKEKTQKQCASQISLMTQAYINPN